MDKRTRNIAWRAAGLGAMSGMRSMAAPAALALAVRRDRVAGIGNTPFAFLHSPRVAFPLYALMIGEMVADKHPEIPSRLIPPALFGRAASGALAGATLFAAGDRSGLSGAVTGLAAAVVSAFATYHLRAQAGKSLGVPDTVLGHLEDGIAILAGWLATR